VSSRAPSVSNTADHATLVTVIDFRRRSMLLHWRPVDGTWTPCEEPASVVHGIASIRAEPPNICLFGQGGSLYLQIAEQRIHLPERNAPRIVCKRALFGLMRICSVESPQRITLFKQIYWSDRGPDFFRWLATKAADSEWRADRGRRWTEGVTPAGLRAG
jgi:hypothetical protein